jgi:hypothetical protein
MLIKLLFSNFLSIYLLIQISSIVNYYSLIINYYRNLFINLKAWEKKQNYSFIGTIDLLKNFSNFFERFLSSVFMRALRSMKQILKFRNLSSVTNMSSGNKYKLFIFHSYNRIICIYWTAIIVVHFNREINNYIKYFPIC